MGMKEINPLGNVSFYRTCDEGNSIQLVKKNLNEISTMMPERVQTTTLRCFVKYDDKFDAAKNAFTQYCKEHLGGSVIRSKEISHS